MALKIKDIIDTFGDLVTCKVKNPSESIEVTRKNIGSFFHLYESYLPKMINTIDVHSNKEELSIADVCVIQPVFEELKLNGNYNPSNSCLNIESQGLFSIKRINHLGEVVEIGKQEYTIRPIFKITRDDDKDYSIETTASSLCLNNINIDILTVIHVEANYFFKGVEKKASFDLNIYPRKLSDWEFFSIDTVSVNVEGITNNQIVPNIGGSYPISIIHKFYKNYVQRDESGNIVNRKSERHLYTNIIKKDINCKLSNGDGFNFKDGILTVQPQLPNSKSRECTLTLTIKGHETIQPIHIRVNQVYGAVEEDKVLTFAFGDYQDKMHVKFPYKSKFQYQIVPLQLIKGKYRNGRLEGKQGITNFAIECSDNDFVKFSIGDDKKSINIKITSDNETQESKIATCKISHDDGQAVHCIELVVEQTPNSIINTSFRLEMDKVEDYTVETIENAEIVLKAVKENKYEDGSTIITPIDISSCPYDVEVLAQIGNELSFSVEGKGSKLIIKPLFSDKQEKVDPMLILSVGVTDSSDKDLVDFKTFSIKVEKNKKDSSSYKFEFIDGIKVKTIILQEDHESGLIRNKVKIVSCEQTINEAGIAENKPLPYNIQSLVTETENMFVAIHDKESGSQIFEYIGDKKVKTPISQAYEFIQRDSCLKLYLVVKYIPRINIEKEVQHESLEQTANKIHLRLFVGSDREIYNDENATIEIVNSEGKVIFQQEINTMVWLFPKIGITEGTIFEGDISMELNESYEVRFQNLAFKDCDEKKNILYDETMSITPISNEDPIEIGMYI